MKQGKIKALMPKCIYAVVCTSRFPESFSQSLESVRSKPLILLFVMTPSGAIA
jgi:hypothetical protein